MRFRNILRFFRNDNTCDKCGVYIGKGKRCECCQEYLDIIERKQKEDIEAKNESKRKDWIRTRDEFLDNYNGR